MTPPFRNILLTPLAALYGGAIRVRSLLYSSGAFGSHRLPFPCISVGNLTLGGTGKTPLVHWMARLLQSNGFQVSILSRGYRGNHEKPGILVSDGERILCSARDCGDEPYWLAGRLQGVRVAVCRDRLRAARLAEDEGRSKLQTPNSKTPTTIYLLDDGFQHRRLHRDLDIVVLDSTDPFGGGRLLPAGHLREPASALERADWAVLSRSHAAREIGDLAKRLREEFPRLRVFRAGHRTSGFVRLSDQREFPPKALEGRRAAVLSAIGRPDIFSGDLEKAGLIVAQETFFRDHHWYTPRELQRVGAAVSEKKADLIVTTEKDAVRLAGMQLPTDEVYAMRIELVWDDPPAFREALLETARRLTRAFREEG